MRLFEFHIPIQEAMDLDNKLNPIYYTWDEYWEAMNPEDKYHDSSAYNWSLSDMNRPPYYSRKILDNHAGAKNELAITQNADTGEIFIQKNDKDLAWDDKSSGIVGHVDNGVLRIEKPYYSNALLKDLKYNGQNADRVQFIKSFTKILNQRAAEERLKRYNKVIQNFKVKGRQFVLRQNKDGNFAVFNDKGQVVAVAQDEWGAILVSVAQEYRGFGLGTRLGKIFREHYPEKNTGGVTASGKKQVRRIWEEFVREALQNGVYSKLVKNREISKERVQEILADLGPRRAKDQTELPPEPESDTSGWLVMKHDGGVVVYHKRIFEQDYSLEELYPFIMGNSLIRDFEGAPAPFLFYVNYENERAEKIVLYGSLQIARDEDHGLAFEIEAADFSDQLETLQGVTIEDGVAYLDEDLDIIKRAFAVEQQYRKQHDPYGEWYNLILEASESKFR